MCRNTLELTTHHLKNYHNCISAKVLQGFISIYAAFKSLKVLDFEYIGLF